jgi:N-acetylmuramoyl-L-alanine amidase
MNEQRGSGPSPSGGRPVNRRGFLGLGVALGAGVVAGSRLDPADARLAPVTWDAGTATLSVPVIGRRAWGAKQARPGLQLHRPRRLTLHHSGVLLKDNADAPGRVRQHQSWHLSLGHPDIDYHYLVDRRGNIYRGRDDRYRGDTQTEYDPTGHFLVCCEGDYQKAQQPTALQLDAVARLFAYASKRWGISPGMIGGHRDYAQTTCPGNRLYAHIKDGDLEQRVTRLNAAYGAVTADVLPARQGRAKVARIENGGR